MLLFFFSYVLHYPFWIWRALIVEPRWRSVKLNIQNPNSVGSKSIFKKFCTETKIIIIRGEFVIIFFLRQSIHQYTRQTIDTRFNPLKNVWTNKRRRTNWDERTVVTKGNASKNHSLNVSILLCTAEFILHLRSFTSPVFTVIEHAHWLCDNSNVLVSLWYRLVLCHATKVHTDEY